MPAPHTSLSPDQVDLGQLTLPDAHTITARLAEYSNDPHQQQHLHPLFVARFADRRLQPMGIVNGLALIAADYTAGLPAPHDRIVTNLYFLAVPDYLRILIDDSHALDRIARLWQWVAEQNDLVQGPLPPHTDLGRLTLPDADTITTRLADYNDDPYQHQYLYPLFVAKFADRRLQPMDVINGLILIAADYAARLGGGAQGRMITAVYLIAIPHYLEALFPDARIFEPMRRLWLATAQQARVISGDPDPDADGGR